MIGTGPWHVDYVRGSAASLHASAAASVSSERGLKPVDRGVRVMEADRPALVLGSSQPETDVDRAAAASSGVEVVRRRSGGGAVLVGPGEVLWVDVTLPAGDPLWRRDVGQAAWWLGDCWARAVAEVTGWAPEVWRGSLQRNQWSPVVCFAGLGSGEVAVGGAKVVGVSQRRTRRGILFQTAALLRWSPVHLMELFDLAPARRAEAAHQLSGAAMGLGSEVGPALLAAVLGEIRRAG